MRLWRRQWHWGLSRGTSFFPCQYDSTSVPYSSSSTWCSYQNDKQGKPGNRQIRQCYSDDREHWKTKYFHNALSLQTVNNTEACNLFSCRVQYVDETIWNDHGRALAHGLGCPRHRHNSYEPRQLSQPSDKLDSRAVVPFPTQRRNELFFSPPSSDRLCPIEGLLEVHLSGVKRPGRETDHSAPHSPDDYKVWSFASISATRLIGVLCGGMYLYTTS